MPSSLVIRCEYSKKKKTLSAAFGKEIRGRGVLFYFSYAMTIIMLGNFLARVTRYMLH